MRFAIINDGVVENIITATHEFIQSSGLIAVELSDQFCDVGYLYDGQSFSKPLDDQKSFIPVKPMYMRLALMEFGMLSTIESALSQPGNEVSKIAFEYALEFRRDDAMINSFAQAFGLSESQVDSLFLRAIEIQS